MTNIYLQRFKTADQRFWERVDKSGQLMPEMTTPCWIWTGFREPNDGYGRFWIDGHNTPAHRFALELIVGPLNSNEKALHRCDNPPCVRNDGHLFRGTAGDNIRDMISKGRQNWTGPINPNPLRGEASPHHKITEEDVLEIRRLSSIGVTSNDIAPRFGIQSRQVRRIVNRERWGHVK